MKEGRNDQWDKPASYCLKELLSSLKERMAKHPSAHQHQKTPRENCLFPKKIKARTKGLPEEARQDGLQGASWSAVYLCDFTKRVTKTVWSVTT